MFMSFRRFWSYLVAYLVKPISIHLRHWLFLLSWVTPYTEASMKWLQSLESSLFSEHFQSWLTEFYLLWLLLFESDQIRYIDCYSNDVGVTKQLSSTTRSRKLAVWWQLTQSLKSAYLHHGVSPQNCTDALQEDRCFTAVETFQTHESHHVHHVSLEKLWLQLGYLT